MSVSGIAVFLPNETICRQTETILSKRKNHVIVNKPITIGNMVEETRKAIELGANIVVVRGHQASGIRLYTSIPAVEVVMTAQKLGLLIVKAKKMVNKPFPKIGISYWGGMLCDTTYFEQLYGVKITTRHLENQNDWYGLVEHGTAEGIDVLIGGEKCARYATQRGFPPVFLSATGEFTEVAINQAETMYEMAEPEKHSCAQFFTVLDSSFNGIVKIGADEQIQTMNRMMEEIPKTSIKSATSQHISEIMPFMGGEKIREVLAGGGETCSAFINNKKNAMMVIAGPIVAKQVTTGAIVFCNRAIRLGRSEGKMKEKFLAGFVAHENLDHMLPKRPGFKDAMALAKIYTQSSSPILVEEYSYEELKQFCQGVHNYSLRKNSPFVVVNAGNISVERQMHTLFGISEVGFDKEQRGTLLKANDGTLMIRAVDKPELPVQKYLLNATRRKGFGLPDTEDESVQRVDTHIIVRTSKDLRKMVSEGRFRKDPYCLLRAFGIALPRTPEHRMDLEILLDKYYKKYLEHHTRYHVLTPEAREKILSSQWDNSNIQLGSFCERVVLTTTRRKISGEYVQDLLDSLYDLSEQEVRISQTSSDGGFLEKTKIRDIQSTLMRYNGNRMLTVKRLSISASTLWRCMRKYGI